MLKLPPGGHLGARVRGMRAPPYEDIHAYTQHAAHNYTVITKAEYAEVSFKRVVSAEPREMDKSSSGFS